MFKILISFQKPATDDENITQLEIRSQAGCDGAFSDCFQQGNLIQLVTWWEKFIENWSISASISFFRVPGYTVIFHWTFFLPWHPNKAFSTGFAVREIKRVQEIERGQRTHSSTRPQLVTSLLPGFAGRANSILNKTSERSSRIVMCIPVTFKKHRAEVEKMAQGKRRWKKAPQDATDFWKHNELRLVFRFSLGLNNKTVQAFE